MEDMKNLKLPIRNQESYIKQACEIDYCIISFIMSCIHTLIRSSYSILIHVEIIKVPTKLFIISKV